MDRPVQGEGEAPKIVNVSASGVAVGLLIQRTTLLSADRQDGARFRHSGVQSRHSTTGTIEDL